MLSEDGHCLKMVQIEAQTSLSSLCPLLCAQPCQDWGEKTLAL